MPNSSLIARWGGVEFTVILSGTSITDAMAQAKELKEYVGTHPIANVAFTISIGLATIQKDDTVLKLLERADTALYKAKNNGRNKVCVSDNDSTVIAQSTYLNGFIA
ncbi:hypothetical protein P20429_3375 [Pseudoalteromonas sp. BSi20429]|nr:hypothetical protein P20429_3375 [Pseudoalteromonas sp. BSi20429]